MIIMLNHTNDNTKTTTMMMISMIMFMLIVMLIMIINIIRIITMIIMIKMIMINIKLIVLYCAIRMPRDPASTLHESLLWSGKQALGAWRSPVPLNP